MSIEDQPCLGRPVTSRCDENVDKINALIREDHRRTIDELCEMSGIPWSSIQRILCEDLHMGRVAAKFVPRLLTKKIVNNCFCILPLQIALLGARLRRAFRNVA